MQEKICRRTNRSGKKNITSEALTEKKKEKEKRQDYHPDLLNIGGLLRDLHPVLRLSKRCRFRKSLRWRSESQSLAQELARVRFTNAPKHKANGHTYVVKKQK